MAQVTRRSAVLGAGAALSVGACGGSSGSSESSGGSASPDAADGPRPLRAPQTAAERRRTRASLRRLDDHPLYSIDWQGAPGALDPRAEPAGSATSERSPYGCTLFAALGRPGRPLIGRNFDWEANPAAVVRSTVRGGPRTLSVTDLSFIGYPASERQRLEDPDRRDDLERAHVAVVDGVNEHGLFIGIANDEEGSPPTPRGRPRIGGLSIQRMVLDHARTVDDAVALIGRYDLDFTGGPLLHYLLVDASGDSAVVEIHEGRARRIRRGPGDKWQVLENFHMAGRPVSQRDSYRRYSTCAKTLDRADGRLSEEGARGLMKSVKQRHTQWSGVYDLADRSLALFTGGDDGTVHRFRI